MFYCLCISFKSPFGSVNQVSSDVTGREDSFAVLQSDVIEFGTSTPKTRFQDYNHIDSTQFHQ